MYPSRTSGAIRHEPPAMVFGESRR
jgi:hypothetical protein